MLILLVLLGNINVVFYIVAFWKRKPVIKNRNAAPNTEECPNHFWETYPSTSIITQYSEETLKSFVW